MKIDKATIITQQDLVDWIDRPPSNDDLDLCNYLSNAVKNQYEYNDEIERLNKGLEYMKLYWSNREEYEKNELLNLIRDKDTSIEWLERAIEEEKKRERLH